MDEVDRLMAGVRLDRQGFAADVASMRASLEGSLEVGAERAGRAVEASLLRAVRTGKLGFEDLKKVALQSLDAIAAAALKGGLQAVLGGGGSGGGGGLLAALAGVAGLPGRATGGPVVGGRGYLVGERGPELFVPTASGRVEAGVPGSGPREVRVSITVNAKAGESADAMRQSSRQVARAVRAALAE